MMRKLPMMSVLLLCIQFLSAQTIQLQTQYARITVDGKGFICSLKDKKTGQDYCPKGRSSALLSLYKNNQYILPVKAVYNSGRKELTLSYANGSVAKLKVEQYPQYLRMQLFSLTPKDGVDDVVWGPYKTTISKAIGEIISVVRSDDFAIGMMGLNDNTTTGPPTESSSYYYVHSPDPKKYPLPSHLKEGQTFPIGGDGINDVAFYSQPEEYFRMNYGNGALLEPAFGSSICMHSKDRKKERMIRFPVYPEGVDPKANAPRYQLVPPTDADYIGSAIALYACPDSLGLKT
ncbi:MAG TPA: hypothetical protein VFL47_12460, partial [Flavisolibacter sp.]|nr:hypothetical protein [Flavisolibacter sp.]